ncbi:MAG: ThuA domain-containing protein [Cytophagaceae bacterium]|nr:ThuA domain-containing protein [Cytophagaceae bacterium]
MKRISLLKRLTTACLLGLSALSVVFGQTSDNPLKDQRVLVFSKTKGFRHSSIPQGRMAIMALGKKHGFAVDTTENSGKFTEANLKNYRVVIFLSTTGDVLNPAQQTDFERYIQAGGAYVGIHAAADTEYDWPWYGKLVGGYFMSHPGNPNVQTGTMIVKDKAHPSTESLPENFQKKDEFYDFKQYSPDVKTLITVDEKTYKDGKMGDFHPMAWYQEYDGGRVFYTNFGHTEETFMEPLFLQHFWGGLRWAASGIGKLDYKKARSEQAPEENRFNREILDEKLYEPTELVVLDDNRVIYTERHGQVKLYNPANKKNPIKTVANIPVYDGREYGLMGANVDPNFNENHWLYLYYSASAAQWGTDTTQHLSRFKYDLAKDTLLMDTEQVLLRVPVKRGGRCCHTGGSIAWDKAGNLYLSTGDDTDPFASDGFSPSDERQGREFWDAKGTSSNTNDLRGKILRIKPKANEAGYDIPAGNLFPVGTEKARPEIYVMGNRNPYRISVDQRTGFLYWGEVGPDAGENKQDRGPRGHDEVNQARKAGYYGWPLFVADNRAYNEYSFEKKESGSLYDPAKPINTSPHNTGLTELPPANKAFIYYPYADSPEFGEVVGKGGRNAMAGPVYYFDDYDSNSKVKFPKYYDGKLFAYDWSRDWINPVTLKANGDFGGMERFQPSWEFAHPMDMQFAKDGSLYVLEYGRNWFAQSDEARLTRITYNAGNRPPVAVASVDKPAGAAPLKVALSAKGSIDYDGDALKYEWTVGKQKFTTPTAAFTFAKPGIYKANLKVTDAAGNSGTQTIEVKVGNEVPKLELAVKGNKTFYFDNQPVDYEVKVTDKEDGSLATGAPTAKKIAEEDVLVNIDYLEGFDKAMIQGHQTAASLSPGKRLIDLSDCKACHSLDKKSIGPAYREVAKKYKGVFQIEGRLSDKIIKGGGGVWGEQAMIAHPQMTKADATQMVKYILSLADEKKASKPVKGSYVTKDNGKHGTYILAASYTDQGNGAIPPQTVQQSVTLRSPVVKATANDGAEATMNYKLPTGSEAVVALSNGSYVVFKGIDLTGISSLTVTAFSSKGQSVGGKIEARAGSPKGKLLGSADVENGNMGAVKMPIAPAGPGMHDVYLVFTNAQAKAGQPLFGVDTVTFERAEGGATSGGK